MQVKCDTVLYYWVFFKFLLKLHDSVLDAEDRLSKATDDLKRVTEHIEQERVINKEVQRRQVT